ncbi:carboxylesterase/lipase family protein [Streptomyces sp. NPDC018031]|uniref:carboxylesterase/lipase family protein n=1 Tax=Streptomyces sp. NPDC018031 TaxID=3365033 RepID=UPI0037954DAE
MDTFRTRDGLVRGRRPVPDVAAVLGIPYAAPPFGADRFRAPRPARPWTGVRDGTRFGPVAPQSACLPGAPSWSPGEEDVLTVNVWTPAEPGDRLPVLVWIHGGAYTFGSSAQPDFDGTALARAGLVVVTLNYRLGFEGFGSVPPGDGTRYPQNRGLLDQIAALRWVRGNIAAFGGDPGNVTVAGQSSGAASIACLMVTERARGLFHRAIVHSPASPCYSEELAAETTRRVAAAAGLPATATALAAASPRTLVAASDAVVDDYRRDPESGARHYDPVIYGPVVDGDVLPTDPLAGIAAGAGREVELLVCHTTHEYWLLDAVGSSAKVTTGARLARFAEDFGLPADLVAGYRALMPHAPVLDVYLSVFGDLKFAEYGDRLADAHAAAGGRTFRSRFARQRTGPDGEVHAWHCADIPFAFGTLADPAVQFLVGGPPSPADHRLARRMTAAWASFAAGTGPGWQPLAPPDGPVHTWTAEGDPVLAETSHRSRRELWRGYAYPPSRP